ncbi:hypothetical protein BKP45_20575 [Anaerobacillus alkalidiazotrophicus]|uniref:Peptidase S9 prolyl oligopeptidase catalytic domain-containing protein n=1 Tax=Anaerobacillus alkalidiazotrophicus TaxID=472963 RepID=A0A1S2M0C8_9BACI|nr:prolyl oligopeptidase family serine peptidase [Anaerobacillus alkalidiazotrophicus]OIJ17953.1 hypothetical protein BKP45_20575 [Anaerobacillus alkalidiazotrophicus]
MIFQLSYLVDNYIINGYLAIPNWVNCSTEIIYKYLNRRYPSAKLPMPKLLSFSFQNQIDQIESIKIPALLYCRGGIGNHGKVKMEWLEQFASHGYIVFAPTYRGNEGSQGRDEFGGSDRFDTIEAFHLLRTLPFIDKKQISIMGFSRGAINATQTAIAIPDTNKLILWSGVASLASIYKERVELRRMLKRVIGTSPQKELEPYHSRSPIMMTKQIHCPTLIIHGTNDHQVPFHHGEELFERLLQHKKDVSFHRYHSLDHHFPLPIHLLATQRMFAWINNNLSQFRV